MREIGQVVESVQTADEVMRLAERHGVELPIAENVRDVLHGDITRRRPVAADGARTEGRIPAGTVSLGTKKTPAFSGRGPDRDVGGEGSPSRMPCRSLTS